MSQPESGSSIGVGTGVLVWRQGRILMGRRYGAHGAGTWSVPGGKLEFGESWQDCAKREVREETGMDVRAVRYLATTNDIFTEDKHFVTIWLEAEWQQHEARITEPDKYVDQAWFFIHDLPQPLFEPCWSNLRQTRPDLFHPPSQQV